MHQRYEEFAELLIQALEKQYQETNITDFNRRRNMIRLLSELYLKGLFADFKRSFKCLNSIILINPDMQEEFQNAMMVITDYLKTYGEVFFQILSKTRREAIEVRISRISFIE